MTISPHEAEEALDAVRDVSQQMRRALNAWGMAYYLILWGLIWLIGFTASQFAPSIVTGYLWAGLDVIGIGLSWYFGFKVGRRFHNAYASRVGLFWLALLGYGMLGAWFVHPVSPHEGALLLIIYVMFGWVIMGLWVQPRLAWLGLFVTALALLGYALLPAYFFILMALLGGGSLLGTGLYILRSWK